MNGTSWIAQELYLEAQAVVDTREAYSSEAPFYPLIEIKVNKSLIGLHIITFHLHFHSQR